MTTDLFGTNPAIPNGTATTHHHGRRALTLGIAASAAIALFLGGMTGTASAAPGTDTSSDSTSAIVEVGMSITLTGLTSSFTLTGIPDAVVPGIAAVTMNVETNNIAGYDVTVAPAAEVLVGTAGNAQTIPIGALSVRETGTTDYTALSFNTVGDPVTVHHQVVRSVEGGEALSNDYTVTIPFVNSDTYTATLDYIATNL